MNFEDVFLIEIRAIKVEIGVTNSKTSLLLTGCSTTPPYKFLSKTVSICSPAMYETSILDRVRCLAKTENRRILKGMGISFIQYMGYSPLEIHSKINSTLYCKLNKNDNIIVLDSKRF